MMRTAQFPELPELDDLLDGFQELPRKMTKKELRQHNANVHAELDNELDDLLKEAEIPKPVWVSDSEIVLIEEQACVTCGHLTQRCQGWFISQHHTTDKFAKRLIAGRDLSAKLPLSVLRQVVAPISICADCAESQVAIERASRSGSYEPADK